MANYNPNSTNYVHSAEPNTENLVKAMDYNSAGQPIVRTSGDTFSWAINISAGSVNGTSYIEKFGMNTDVDANKETIWDGGGIYTYIATAETVTITSTSGSDSAAGTGARTVEVQGLNSSYEVVTETLTVGGAGGSTEFLRVFRAVVITAGTDGVNIGTVSVTSNSTATVLAKIGVDGTGSNAAGRGQTFMALYTIPAGKTGYLTQWTVGSGKQNTDAVAFILSRDSTMTDAAFNSKDIITVSATTFDKNYTIPLQFTEKTDIEVRAYSTTNNSLVSSSFNLILYTNQP
jgi:hypothetical protein